MISKSALEQSIKEAADAVQDRERTFIDAQSGLVEAQRELRLLMELAELRGLKIDEGTGLTQDSRAQGAANGSSLATGGRPSSPTKTALLAAVFEILTQRGEPMQIRELMAAVQEQGVAIPGSGQQANLIAHISRDDRIVRPRRGFYALRAWGIEDARPAPRRKRRRTRRSAGAGNE